MLRETLKQTTPATKAYTMVVVITVAALLVVASVGLYLVLIYQGRANFDLTILSGVGALVIGLANQVSILFVSKSQGNTETKLNAYNDVVETKAEEIAGIAKTRAAEVAMVAAGMAGESSKLLAEVQGAQTQAKDVQEIAKQQATLDATQIQNFNQRLDALQRMLEEALIPKREGGNGDSG